MIWNLIERICDKVFNIVDDVVEEDEDNWAEV